MSVFPPWQVTLRRGRFLAALSFLVRSRLHQEHLVTLAASYIAARIETVSHAPREKRVSTRSEMFSFGGRWSATPPHGGSPFG